MFNLKTPSANNFEIEIDYPQGTCLTLDVIPTVSGMMKTDYGYSFLSNTLKITQVYAKDTLSKILDNKFFDGNDTAQIFVKKIRTWNWCLRLSVF